MLTVGAAYLPAEISSVFFFSLVAVNFLAMSGLTLLFKLGLSKIWIVLCMNCADCFRNALIE